MIRFTVFDRWGKQTGTVENVLEAVHKDVVNGEDSLTLVVADNQLSKGQRIVWRDKWGEWHEHVVSEVTDIHSAGKLYANVYCENSIAELYTDYIDDLRPYDATSSEAVRKALSTSRWVPGDIDVTGIASASFYHVSAREALSLVVENWGAELSTTVRVTGTEVTERRVNLTTRRGGDTGKRFEYTKDLTAIEREVSTDDVYTALYGYGKGLECFDDEGNSTGGYSRKLTFGSVNGGKDYVADEDAKLRWGLPDGKGGVKHSFGKVEFSDCEDERELLKLTQDALKEQSKPRVSYKASVVNLADAGYDFEDARAGDTVQVVDRELGERIEGRVLSCERHLFDEKATTLTLGNLVRSIGGVIGSQAADLAWIKNHAASWDGAASVSTSYINGVINSMNAAMNESGGYTYYEPGEGITTYDRPVDQNPTMAIQLKGGGFRIANRKKSDGSWDWRTFGTGDGFVADEITAGTIKGGSNYWNLSTGDLLFKQGKIADAAGKSEWNLSTGAFRATDVTATGTFTSSNSPRNMKLHNGRIEALDDNGTVLTQIQTQSIVGVSIESYYEGVHISARDYPVATGNVKSSIDVVKDGRIYLRGSELVVGGISGSSYSGYTGTVEYLSSVIPNGNYVDYEFRKIRFVNGIMVGWA